MHCYYAKKLSAERLRLCYEIAPPRVKRYLEAEIEFVLGKISPFDLVLELGCGYGRVLHKLVEKTRTVFGIDTSHASLCLAQKTIGEVPSCYIFGMDAAELGFKHKRFDVVVCIQNGISAFKIDQRKLIEEAMRVTRSEGKLLFSSYSEHFWEDRLEWFRLQSEQGLIGEIDYSATGDGVIVCKDGFKSSTVGPDDFNSLISGFDIDLIITEVNDSSIFYEIRVK
ncbi:MAG: class I SAM-dependent methyltransferase [Candidatus Aminicenantes bacterium]|nr:MAG: class I SAM-dependent methyltransferase [Candidatus Aminicenantes bacterium]